MVRADDLPFWPGNFSACVAHRSVPHAGRHSVRSPFVHGSRFHGAKFYTVRARLLVVLLAFAQPLLRGFSRYFTWLRFKRTPANVIRRHERLPEGARSAGTLSRRVFW